MECLYYQAFAVIRCSRNLQTVENYVMKWLFYFSSNAKSFAADHTMPSLSRWSLPNLHVWSYYTEDYLAHGPPYDIGEKISLKTRTNIQNIEMGKYK